MAGVTDLIGAGVKILDRVLPDPQARLTAKVKLLELERAGELAELQAQTDLARGQQDINKTEAASNNAFVSGWRPAVGWVCVAGLAYSLVLQPVLSPLCLRVFGSGLEAVDMGELMTLLVGMLGIGGLRTFEKIRGVTR